MNLHKLVKDNYQTCTTRRFRKRKCALKLDSCSDYTVTGIDIDKFAKEHKLSDQANDKLCDFILLISDGLVGVLAIALELKSGEFNATEAYEQLQAGANYINAICNGERLALLLPVVLHKGANVIQTKKLAKYIVRFSGDEYEIIRKPCGIGLKDIMKEYFVSGKPKARKRRLVRYKR